MKNTPGNEVHIVQAGVLPGLVIPSVSLQTDHCVVSSLYPDLQTDHCVVSRSTRNDVNSFSWFILLTLRQKFVSLLVISDVQLQKVLKSRDVETYEIKSRAFLNTHFSGLYDTTLD